ncbi:MAG: ABC transporter ATP-binding protein [Halobaculum sp.]
MTILELDGVVKSFGELTAVDGVSLAVKEGELVCLLGPSGCGKSTTLRTIAGFETPDAGTVRIAGRDVTATPPNERDCSMVFQDWALFPNKTVAENVGFGLKMAGMDRATRADRVAETLSLVEMSEFADSRPTDLSGGQQQRVALARSLAVEPEILLLDEPLSNLDRRLRESMQLEIKEIQRETGTTMVYVTHDQDEAFTLADRIGILDDGRVVQTGAPADVYADPTTLFVESFLGMTNTLSCTVTATDAPAQTETVGEATDGGRRSGVRLETPLGASLVAPDSAGRLSVGDRVTASIRPERLAVGADGADEQRAFTATGTVRSRLHRGSRIRYELRVGDAELVTHRRIDDRLDVTDGETVRVSCDADAVTYFDADGGRLR